MKFEDHTLKIQYLKIFNLLEEYLHSIDKHLVRLYVPEKLYFSGCKMGFSGFGVGFVTHWSGL